MYHTIADYQKCATDIRKCILLQRPIPQNYQRIIEQFVPTEERFPNRNVIPIYEYAYANPSDLTLKHGFKRQFVFIFITNDEASQFTNQIKSNYLMQWVLAKHMMEVCDNVVFIKTRGLTNRLFLRKLEKGKVTSMPLCLFYFDIKLKQLTQYLNDSHWCFRIIYGPPIDVPLYGIQEGDMNLKQEFIVKKQEAKQEVKLVKQEPKQRSKSPMVISDEENDFQILLD